MKAYPIGYFTIFGSDQNSIFRIGTDQDFRIRKICASLIQVLFCHLKRFPFKQSNTYNYMTITDAWPSFKFRVIEIRYLLNDFLTWRIAIESFESNKGARIIASSAVLDVRFQSCVARGYPRWLSHIFGFDQVPQQVCCCCCCCCGICNGHVLVCITLPNIGSCLNLVVKIKIK